jgi:hypothetical protein
LDFHDVDSIQRQNPESHSLSRLLFIPCLCHRLNNADHRLIRDFPIRKELIGSLHALARFCRKPNQRRQIGATCPEFIEIRWLDDHRILSFVVQHEDVINSLPENPILVTPIFHECSMLRETLFNLMSSLESSHTSLARGYPLIRQAIQVRDHDAEECSDYRLPQGYRAAAQVVASYLLQSTSDLLQLSDVLTPQGRKEARSQLINQIRNFEAPDQPRDEPILWLPDESRSEVLELFNFENNVTLRNEAADELDRQDDEDEEENSPIDEEHGDFGDVMDDPVPPTSEDPPITVFAHPEPWDCLSIRATHGCEEKETHEGIRQLRQCWEG